MSVQFDSESILREAFQSDFIPWGREIATAVGECAFRRTFSLSGDTSADGFFRGATRFERAVRGSAKSVDAFVLHQLQVSGLTIGLFALTRWYEQGCPIVMLTSQTYAAALAATSLPPEIEVTVPYTSTLVQFPAGLTNMWGVLIHCPELNDGLWTINTFFQDGRLKKTCVRLPLSEHIRGGVSVDDLRLGDANMRPKDYTEEDVIAENWACKVPDDAALRCVQIATRIGLSACLAITAHRPSSGSNGGGSERFRETSKSPFCRVLSFGQPVQVDCRHAIRDYIAHGSKSRGPLTLQFMVRGHWRDQACGPRFSERRLTWIEPYWKGPEDAPVNVRPHVMKESRG